MKKKVLAGFGIVMLLAFGLLLWRLDLPHWKKLDLSKIEQMSSATTVYDGNDVAVGALHGSEHRIWVALSSVPEHVQQAFIAAEDLRFYRHHGVDFHRLMGALWQDIRTLSYAQGGSTITQQLIKLTHLSQVKTLSRKAQEIVLALQLEKVMDKRQILEAYLNAVYFGHGAYGIEAASNAYFDKPSSRLTLAEGALLAGIIKAPSSYAPHLNPEKATARRNSILEIMEKNGMITAKQRRDAQAEAVHLAEDNGRDTKFAWYMDAVLEEATAILNISADELMTGRYEIHTALNPMMQAEAKKLFEDSSRFPADGASGAAVQAALTALDTETGALEVVVGGRRYDVLRGLNRAMGIRRQPGSAIKPVSTYAAAIDAYGYLPSSIIDDTPRTFAGGYVPGNAGGASYGPVTLREALSRSLNVATVDLADTIGVPAVRTYANRFGLSLDAADANLSLALGALTYGVSPAQLGAAYCALANGGMRVTPHTIRWIGDGDGRVLYRANESKDRALSPEAAYMVTDMLKTAATRGSAKALAACGMPVAGKTGTVAEGSDGNRDIWTVAYTPETAVCVWMGFDDPGTGDRLPASEGGSGYPARLCAAFLRNVSGHLSGRDFKRPTGVRTALVDSVALSDDRIPLLSTERTPPEYTRLEVFRADAMPDQFSTHWTSPATPQDFRLLTGPGETPVLAFTPQDSNVQYVLTRSAGGESAEVAVLQGEAGREIRYADDDCDLSQLASYALLPRNGLLFARGELLAGSVTQNVAYVPGGLLNTIMGVGEAEAPPTPAEVQEADRQSLFD